MKYFLITIALMLSFSFSSVQAAEPVHWKDIVLNNTGDECGVMETTETASGLVVNPNDASICQEDVALNSIYFIFGKVIEEMNMVNDLINVSSGVKETAIGLGIGDPIVTVLSTVAAIVMMVGTMLILFLTVSGLLKSTGGEFMGQKWDTGKVIGRVGGSFMLMVPAFGGLSLIQISVLVCAIFANLGGNYIWGNFLNLVQVKSTQIESSHKQIEYMSLDQSNVLISGELCMKRTSQKMFEDKWPKLGSDFSDDSILNADDEGVMGSILSGLGLGYDKEDLKVSETLDRYDACMTPANIIEVADLGSWYSQDDNADKYIKRFSRGNIEACKSDTYAYDEKLYGSSYLCSYVNYDYIDTSDLEVDAEGSIFDVDVGEQIRQGVKQFRSSFSRYDEYKSVLKLESSLESMLEDKGKINFQDEDLIKEYQPIIVSLIAKIKNGLNSTIGTNSDLKKNMDMRYKATFTYHQYVFNNLMGALYNESDLSVSEIRGGAKKMDIQTDRSDDIASFGHQMVEDLAAPAADYLEKSHCAEFWSELKSTRKSIRVLDKSMDKLTESVKGVSFECMNIEKESGQLALSYNTIDSQYINADENPAQANAVAFKNAAGAYHKNTVAPQAANKAKVKQFTLALWYYVARQAVITSLTDDVKESADDMMPIKIRKQGWAGAGGYMLNIAANQKNASQMYDQILNNISWGTKMGSGSSDYINVKAFESDNDVPEDAEESYKANYQKMNWDNFFSADAKRVLNAAGAMEKIEDDGVGGWENFKTWIENFLTQPMVYIEQASGIDRKETDVTFREAIKECASAGNCKIGDTHPLNALMQFGHELISVTTTIMLVDVIVKGIASIDTDEGGSASNGSKSKLLSVVPVVGTILKSLIGIAKALSVILDFLLPFILSLLFVGLLFAYIVPTIPYIAFTIVLINWIILIIELMVSMPIWLILYALTNEDGTSKTDVKMLWNFYGQLLLKPAFVVIALVVGWSISTISLYIINMTAFSSYIGSGLNATGSFATGMIDIVMFYIVYIILVFIAIKQSFSVINTLPDTIFGRLNIQSTGDSSMINEMGVERLLQAAAMQNVIKDVHQTAKGNVQGMSKAQTLEGENRKLQSQVDKLQGQLKSKNEGFDQNDDRTDK